MALILCNEWLIPDRLSSEKLPTCKEKPIFQMSKTSTLHRSNFHTTVSSIVDLPDEQNKHLHRSNFHTTVVSLLQQSQANFGIAVAGIMVVSKERLT